MNVKPFTKLVGTEGRNRTDTPVKELDFESSASTSFTTPAMFGYYRKTRGIMLVFFQKIPEYLCKKAIFIIHSLRN
ncbi:MAG: hypothetical protein RL637_1062 [Pseudomonadota bacterium]